MSKEDYIAIAAIFKTEPDLSNVGYAKRLADYFQTQNPRFDREVFLGACGVKES